MAAKKGGAAGAKGGATDDPVVFVHGLGGSKEDWDALRAELPARLRGEAVDLPGTAGGPQPLEGYDPESLARWLSAVLFRDLVRKVTLVGHSLGARVVGELAALQPERVTALVLVSPLGAASYSLGEKLKWKAMSRRSILAGVPEATMRRATAYGFEVDGPGKLGFVERATAARTGRDADHVVRAVEKSVDGILESRPLSDRLRGTRMPLLVVAGAKDPLAPPDNSREIVRARPDARFVEMPGLGHYPMLEAPAKLAPVLVDFLTSARA